MKEQEPKRPSWEEFWSYLKREGKGHTEFRLVLYENKTAYIHVMNRDSESFNFELPKIDWDEAERRASFELSPDWTEEEYEWASDLTKELRYDSNLGTDGKKRVIAHLRKWISRVSGETPKPYLQLPNVKKRLTFDDKTGELIDADAPKLPETKEEILHLWMRCQMAEQERKEWMEASERWRLDYERVLASSEKLTELEENFDGKVSGEAKTPDLETLQARTIFLEGIILANERPKAEQSTPHTHDLTLTQKRYSDGTIEYFEAGEFISRDFLRGRTKKSSGS